MASRSVGSPGVGGLNSELAEDFRLVAMDMRGNGSSDKPREGYTDSGLWADDVNAAIQALSIDQPLICGWSYGPLVILDYLRHYGEDGISGLTFVGGVTKLGRGDVAEKRLRSAEIEISLSRHTEVVTRLSSDQHRCYYGTNHAVIACNTPNRSGNRAIFRDGGTR